MAPSRLTRELWGAGLPEMGVKTGEILKERDNTKQRQMCNRDPRGDPVPVGMYVISGSLGASMRCGMVRIRGGSVGRGECKVMCGEPQTGWG